MKGAPLLPGRAKMPKEKTLTTKIIQMDTTVAPTAMGQLGITIFGLGDDSLVYRYDLPRKIWVVFEDNLK